MATEHDVRGTKHTCLRCETRFYDLRKPAAVCPRCGADAHVEQQKAAAAPKKRRSSPKPPAPKPVEVEVDEDAQPAVDDALDDDDEDAAPDLS